MKNKIVLLIIAFSFIKYTFSQNCIAGFSYSINANTVQFTDTSDTGGSTLCSTTWDFGDGQTSLLNNPNHTYASTGEYTVILTIETSFDTACVTIGCTDVFVDTVEILSIDTCNLLLSHIKGDPSQNGGADGWIDLSVSGGVAPYLFNWSHGEITEDVSGLSEGSYTVVVFDSEGCVDSLTVDIINPNPCTINLSSSQTNVSVNGGNDGSIDVTTTGAQGTVDYLWSNGASSEDISGLTAGEYTVVAIDTAVCSDSLTIEITEPLPCTISLSSNQTHVSVNGGADGSIDVTTTGAHGSVVYLWSNGASTEDISGLVAGAYTLTATDSLSCQDVLTVTITEPSLPPVEYGIQGNVYAKTALLPEGMALLVNEEYSIIEKSFVRNGFYQFTNMQAGQYYIYVVPYFGFDYEYFPRYYSTYYGASAYWTQAQAIDVDSIEIADVNLMSNDEVFYGDGHICGQILYGTEANSESDIFNQDWFGTNRSISSSYAQNMTCLLINDQNLVVDYSISNALGEYYFDNVPFGSYKIHIEYSGKSMLPIYVDLNSENDTVCNLGMTIGEEQIINIEERIIESGEFNCWPNPFSDKLNIQLQEKHKTKVFTVDIVDMYGRSVLQMDLQQKIGEINTSGLRKGVYLIRLKSGDQDVFSKKIQKK